MYKSIGEGKKNLQMKWNDTSYSYSLGDIGDDKEQLLAMHAAVGSGSITYLVLCYAVY